MSLDYPNRKDWLAVRRTLRHSLVVEFASTVAHDKGTFKAGRNVAKRLRKEYWEASRLSQIASYAGRKAPKLKRFTQAVAA